MKLAIIEDEAMARKRLERLIKEIDPQVEIAFSAGSCEDALRLLESEPVDGVFLDINLVQCNAFEILEKLSYSPAVIFVTAYDEYAVKAFEEQAIDYILKPVTKERLEVALARLKKMTNAEKENAYRVAKRFLKKIPIKVGEDIILLDPDDIVYVQADDKKSIFVTKSGSFSQTIPLRKVQEMLPDDVFVRVHKSYIVSLNHIKKISRWFSRGYVIETDTGELIKVSKGYQEEFMRKIGMK